MARYLATRQMKCFGKILKPGDPVPMSKLPPRRRKQLIDQERVALDSASGRTRKGS